MERNDGTGPNNLQKRDMVLDHTICVNPACRRPFCHKEHTPDMPHVKAVTQSRHS